MGAEMIPSFSAGSTSPAIGESVLSGNGGSLYQHQRELAAIVSIDMKQYSWFMSIDESSTHETAKAGLKRFEQLLERYDGRTIAVAGDGIIARLTTADDAVNMAIEFQEQMSNDPLPIAEDSFAQFRIGIHFASVIEENGTIHGTGVNVAKRIEGLADPGGILVSGAVFDALEGPEGAQTFSSEFLGQLKLKNISQPITAYRLQSQSTSNVVRPSIRHSTEPLPTPKRPSIAVIPFNDICVDQDQTPFCNALSQEIVSNLSKFHDLFVISYSSSTMFRGVDATPQYMGEELGVEYLLFGSVNRSNKRMRVTANLIETSSGKELWADKFDRNVEDIFDFQDEVTQLIASRLAVKVEDVEIGRARANETDNLEAYGLVLQAQENLFSYTAVGNRAARWFYEKAIERDPNFARAYAGLSRTHIYDWRYLWTDTPDVSLKNAMEAAQLAVELNDVDPCGYAELAFVNLWSKEIDRALGLYERALQLNPNSADILAEFADALAYAGRLDDAEAKLLAAMRLNPFYPDWYLWYLGDIYYGMGRYADVISSIEQMKDPSEGLRLLAAAHAMSGNEERARKFALKVLERQPNFSVKRWAAIQPDMDAEIQERFMMGLKNAGLPD